MKSADFKKIVTKELAPFLRENRWKGTGFDYNKHIGNIVRALTIQPSSSGGKFCIETGVHFDFIPLPVEKDLSKLKTWDMDITSRLTPNDETDFWWEFPKTDAEIESLFSKLKELISSKGEAYFNHFDNWEEIVSQFTTDSIENGDTKSFIRKPQTRTALFLARMNQYLNNHNKAIEFSEYGLSKIVGNKGSGLIPDFEEIIKKAGNNNYTA